MFYVEGSVQPETFGSIPRALWWSVATLTTVGYGDVYPITPMGKILASLMALIGIAAVAMPAGILAAAFTTVTKITHKRVNDRYLKVIRTSPRIIFIGSAWRYLITTRNKI